MRDSIIAIKQVFLNSIKLDKIAFKAKPFLITASLLMAIVSGIATLAQYSFQGLLINKIVNFGSVDVGQIFYFSIALIVIQAIPSMTNMLDVYFSKMIWLSLTNIINQYVLKKKTELNISEHEDPKLKDVIQRVDENGDWRIINSVDRQLWIVRELVSFILSTGIIFFSYP